MRTAVERGRIADILPVTSQYLAGASVPPSTAPTVFVASPDETVVKYVKH